MCVVYLERFSPKNDKPGITLLIVDGDGIIRSYGVFRSYGENYRSIKRVGSELVAMLPESRPGGMYPGKSALR